MTLKTFQQRKRSLSWVNVNGENCRSLQPGFKFVNSFQDLFRPRPWEKNFQLTFNPFQQRKRSLSWVNVNGENCRSLQPGIAAENVLFAGQNGDMQSIRQLKFQNPKQFVAGRLNENVHNWNFIFEQNSTSQEIRDWVGKGVDLHQHIIPFKGSFKGSFGGIEYNHNFPPQRIFNNSAKCIPFTDFINSTIMERLRNGSIECVGKVGEVDSPYTVSPLTIEP